MRTSVLLSLLTMVLLAACTQCGGKPAARRGESQSQSQPLGACIKFPVKPNSVRFAVIGDSGSGDRYQYQVAAEMEACRRTFPFNFVIMLGDNITGGHSPRDFYEKFENPYKALLDSGVKFYASLGNHDRTLERFYAPFNMGGKTYYSFKRGNVTFFALDSDYMDSGQLDWIKRALQSATTTPWKICFFHHPLYSDGRAHGGDLDLRHLLQPIFEQHGVDAVFSGHDHVYERLKPQHGIYYFVEGSSGHLRYHNLRKSLEMAAGFDTDRAFMLVEVAGDQLYFQAISRTGQVVDSGVLQRQRS